VPDSWIVRAIGCICVPEMSGHTPPSDGGNDAVTAVDDDGSGCDLL
jgi:hypothetical protein